jgi:hypothetical protein
MTKRKRLSPVKTNSKGQTGLSIAILHSPQFRKGRKKTKMGRLLYNSELERVKRKAEEYGIEIKKKLPKKFKL